MNPEILSLLSDEELRTLAEKMNIYVPEGLERIFLIEEIIDAYEDDTSDKVYSHDAPDHLEEKKLAGTGFIPGRLEDISIPDYYNETYINAIVRDPLWIFAFWDIADSTRQKYIGEAETSRLLLRISEATGFEPSFSYDIVVSFDDRKWYINVPHPKRSYMIDLCIVKCHKVRILARSNIVRMPSQYLDISSKLPQVTRSLLVLSGSEELHLIEPKEENSLRIMSMEGE
ncbi:MAG: DUF4912 domain-containing protein [Rectinema sp.]